MQSLHTQTCQIDDLHSYMFCCNFQRFVLFCFVIFKPEITAVLEDESTIGNIESATIFILFLEQNSFPGYLSLFLFSQQNYLYSFPEVITPPNIEPDAVPGTVKVV